MSKSVSESLHQVQPNNVFTFLYHLTFSSGKDTKSTTGLLWTRVDDNDQRKDDPLNTDTIITYGGLHRRSSLINCHCPSYKIRISKNEYINLMNWACGKTLYYHKAQPDYRLFQER